MIVALSFVFSKIFYSSMSLKNAHNCLVYKMLLPIWLMLWNCYDMAPSHSKTIVLCFQSPKRSLKSFMPQIFIFQYPWILYLGFLWSDWWTKLDVIFFLLWCHPNLKVYKCTYYRWKQLDWFCSFRFFVCHEINCRPIPSYICTICTSSLSQYTRITLVRSKTDNTANSLQTSWYFLTLHLYHVSLVTILWNIPAFQYTQWWFIPLFLNNHRLFWHQYSLEHL